MNIAKFKARRRPLSARDRAAVLRAAMLTVLVAAEDDAIALAATLAALVPAAAEGLVRRVTVITPAAATGALSDLIEASGAARAVTAGGALAMWRSQFAQAGEGWRLCLLAGMAPAGDWAEAVARHAARPQGRPAAFALSGSWRARLIAGAARIAGRVHPRSGLLTPGAWPSGKPLALLPARLEDRRGHG